MSSLYCQGSTLSRIIHVGMPTTMECDLFHSNVFPQCFYILHHDYKTRNATTSYWSHDKQETSSRFTIGPILNEIDPLKQFLIS